MRRLCGRPGCSGPATATFTFDATRCVVWLNPLSDGTARAGDLCTRHADALAPPQGWERVDRRPVEVPATGAAGATSPTATPAVPTPNEPSASTAAPDGDSGERDDLLPARKRRRKRWSEVPTLFEADESAPTLTDAPPSAEPDPPEPTHPSEPAWLPRYASEVDLDGVLDADTPLLARAFRNVRGGEPDERDEHTDDTP